MKTIEMAVPSEGLTISFKQMVKPVVKRTVVKEKPIEKLNLVIHVPSGEKGDNKYYVTIGMHEAGGTQLRATVKYCLKEFNDKIPDFLDGYERKLLEDILGE